MHPLHVHTPAPHLAFQPDGRPYPLHLLWANGFSAEQAAQLHHLPDEFVRAVFEQHDQELNLR